MTKTINYVGISRDHSGSMRSIRIPAVRDYNDNVAAFRDASSTNDQETKITVAECGYGRTERVRIVDRHVVADRLQTLFEHEYTADGVGTPLFDSVGELIEELQRAPVADDENVSYLVMAVTDGAENASRKYNADTIMAKIKQLQATDLWTFVFRVPVGYARNLTRLGIPEGNILEWEQTQRGVEKASAKTREAINSYMKGRSEGQTSTKTFYAGLADVTSKDVETALDDVSKEVLIWPVSSSDNDAAIRDFVEARLNGNPMLKGAAFYQLTPKKDGHEVQDYKKILIRDKTTKAVYFGSAARQLIGLPTDRTVTLKPGQLGNFDVYVQSTSVNRKVKAGSELIYWANQGTRFKEGISAR